MPKHAPEAPPPRYNAVRELQPFFSDVSRKKSGKKLRSAAKERLLKARYGMLPAGYGGGRKAG